ncbi:Nucleolar Complex 2 protein, partial [Spiromyces aspiralis]
MLSIWQEEVTKHHTIKALRRIISAFRAASVVNERSNKDISSAYHIDNDAVFNKVMVVALKYVPKELDYHLSQQDNRNPPSDNGKEKKKQQQQPQKNPAAISPSQHPAWRRLRLMVKSYLGSFLYMLRGLPETSMIQYMIKQSEATLPYLVCFPKLAREYIRTLLSYFGEPSSDDTIRL